MSDSITITLPKTEPGMVFHIYRSDRNNPIKIDTIASQIIAVPEEEPVRWMGLDEFLRSQGCSSDATDAAAYALKGAYGAVEKQISDEIFLGEPDGCQHEWVTWTGLHGTITDCTKCKAVK